MVEMNNNADEVTQPPARRANSPLSPEEENRRAGHIIRLTRDLADRDAERRVKVSTSKAKAPLKRRWRRSSDAGVADDVGEASRALGYGVKEPEYEETASTAEQEGRTSDAGAADWPTRLEELRARRDAHDEPYHAVSDALLHLFDVIAESGKNIVEAGGELVESLAELGDADEELLVGVGVFTLSFAYSFMYASRRLAS